MVRKEMIFNNFFLGLELMKMYDFYFENKVLVMGFIDIFF